ncbi:Rap1a/Tai family immunity protein [Rhizobium subbaraonis]|uniref:Rap1a/Tai family immunity protein n=1 Tax=Rhizobium subbaraonis TaxID=908946 RepID=UPI000BE374A7
MIKSTVPALLFLAIPCIASAEISKNTLFNKCDQGKKTYDVSYAIILTHHINPELKQGICIPESTTFGETENVVCDYLKEHPERRGEDDRVLAVESLKHAYPCQK